MRSSLRVCGAGFLAGVLLLLGTPTDAQVRSRTARAKQRGARSSAKKRPTKKQRLRKSRRARRPAYQTVVVGGLRKRPRLDSPRFEESLGHSEIQRAAPRSTPELLADVPGVLLQKTNHGGGSPFIRGLTGQHVLLLIDGIRLNNGTTRYGPNQALNTVDAFSLRRVEVLRGPGAVLHGSDAVGGVVSLLSRQPRVRPGRGWHYAGMATARFGTADFSQSYNVGVEGGYGRVAARVGASFKDFSELTGGRGIGKQAATGYDEGAWDGSLRVQLNARWMLQATTNSVRQVNVPRTDRFTPSDFRYYRKQFRDLVYLRVVGSQGKLLQGFSLTAGYHGHTEGRERFRISRNRIERERDEVRTAAVMVHAQTNLGKWSQLVYGAELYYDHVASRAEREGIDSGAIADMAGSGFRGRFVDGSSYLHGGLFIHDEIRPLPWFRLHLGGRLALSRATVPVDPLAAAFGFAPAPISATFVGPVGSLALSFAPHRTVRLIAGVHQGFRAPNLDDYSHVGSEGGAFDVPSPNLRHAERSTTIEVGVRLAHPRVHAQLFGHYSFLTGWIARQFTGGLIDGEPAAIRVNGARGYLAGLDATVALRLPARFEVVGWVSWTRGDLDQPGRTPTTQPIRRIPPLQGRVALRWRHRTKMSRREGRASPVRIWAEAALRFADRQRRLSPGDRTDGRICPDGPPNCIGTPAFAAVHLGAGAQISRSFDVTFWLHNISNQPYKFHGSGVFAAGVSALLQLRFRF